MVLLSQLLPLLFFLLPLLLPLLLLLSRLLLLLFLFLPLLPQLLPPAALPVAALTQVLSAFAFTLENAATENYYSNQSDIPTDSGKTGEHKCIFFIQGWLIMSALIG